MRLPEALRATGMFGLGAVGLLGAVACTVVAPRAGLTGWLAAVVMLQGLPLGALVLLAMMPLVRGRWEQALGGSCIAVTGLWTLAALAFLPVLLGMGAIYGWLHEPPETAFQRAWLNALPFALRSILWFVGLAFIARKLVGGASRVVCAFALMILTLGGSLMAVDWLMSLDPKFHSSGFGLQVFALECCAAYAVIVIVRLIQRPEPAQPALLGSLLLVFLLLWVYFQFMPYLIVWSGNLPEGAQWYAVRSAGPWPWVLAAGALLGGVPLLALLLAPVRRSPRALLLAAISVLAGKAAEFAWLALPGRGAVAGISFAFSLCALGACAASFLSPWRPCWPRWRRRRPA